MVPLNHLNEFLCGKTIGFHLIIVSFIISYSFHRVFSLILQNFDDFHGETAIK